MDKEINKNTEFSINELHSTFDDSMHTKRLYSVINKNKDARQGYCKVLSLVKNKIVFQLKDNGPTISFNIIEVNDKPDKYTIELDDYTIKPESERTRTTRMDQMESREMGGRRRKSRKSKKSKRSKKSRKSRK